MVRIGLVSGSNWVAEDVCHYSTGAALLHEVGDTCPFVVSKNFTLAGGRHVAR